MASREIISYDKGVLVKALKWGSPIFLAFYLIWSLLPLFIMLMASMKDLLDAFEVPKPGDWASVTMFFDFSPTFTHYVALQDEKIMQ